MTNEQQEKSIELRKLVIGYRSIVMAMNDSRDILRNFCKAQGRMVKVKVIRSLKKNR